MSYPPCAQTGRPPCINDAGEIVDPSRGPWWAHPMVTKFTAVPVSLARVQPVLRRSAVRRPLRGFGDVSMPSVTPASWVTSAWNDYVASLDAAAVASLPSAASVSAAAGLPTSWLTAPLTSLGGIPGWAALALGGGLLLFVFAASGGRRR